MIEGRRFRFKKNIQIRKEKNVVELICTPIKEMMMKMMIMRMIMEVVDVV